MARIEMSTVTQGIRRVDQAARLQSSLAARFRFHQALSGHGRLSSGPAPSLRARTQAHTLTAEFGPPQPVVSEPEGEDPAALGAQHAQELEAAVEAGDDTEVTRILGEIEAHGDDPAYAEAFTREPGPEGARQLFGQLAWDNPEGVTILADTIAAGLDGYSLDELENYFIELENDPNGGDHPYDALILNSPNASGRTFTVGINYVQGDGLVTEPFTQFFGDEHPAAVVAGNLPGGDTLSEVVKYLESLWAGKPDTPANPEDAVAAQAEREGENNDLAWSLALTVVGLDDPERAAEIVAVVENEYGGDYRAFLDDASNPDSPYHDVYELHDRYEDDIRDKRDGE